MNHRDIVKSFAERRINTKTRDISWRGTNLSCAGRTLNSYHWWPLAHYLEDGIFLKQGDYYSTSTSSHQALVQSCCNGPTVSFSALEAAGIRPEHVTLKNLVSWNPDTQIQLRRDWKDDPWIRMDTEEKFSPPAQGLLVHLGKLETQAYWHVMGASLLETDKGQFLCSMDERSYFVAQLGVTATTVDGAFTGLKPDPVKRSEAAGRQVVRQGEWFFMNTGMRDRDLARSHGWTIQQLRRVESRVRPLPRRDLGSNPHDCRQLALPDGNIMATGCVRHPEHSMLKLGKTWWEVHRNTEIQSWSQEGQFD